MRMRPGTLSRTWVAEVPGEGTEQMSTLTAALGVAAAALALGNEIFRFLRHRRDQARRRHASERVEDES